MPTAINTDKAQATAGRTAHPVHLRMVVSRWTERDSNLSRTDERNSAQSGSGISVSSELISACTERIDSQVERQRRHPLRCFLSFSESSIPSIKLTKFAAFKCPNIFFS